MVAGKLVDQVIAYESGEMTAEDTIAFFAELIKTGMAWILQGSYGRQAALLIDNGIVDRQGNILKEIELP